MLTTEGTALLEYQPSNNNKTGTIMAKKTPILTTVDLPTGLLRNVRPAVLVCLIVQCLVFYGTYRPKTLY